MQEQAQLLNASRKTMQNLTKEQASMTFEQNQKLRKEMFEFTRLQNQQSIDVIESLDKQEVFIKNQEALRSYFSPPGLVNIIQRGGIFTAFGAGISGRAELAVPALAASAVLSQRTNVLLLKGLLQGDKKADILITPVLAIQEIQKLVYKKLLKDNK